MRGRIGRGWAPETEEQAHSVLAAGLLREALENIWSVYKENKHERQTQRRHDSEKEDEA